MAASFPRRRGFTLIEGLIAAVIVGVAITSMFSIWWTAFNRVTRSRELMEATQLARAEVERAKAFGAANLPLGTYTQASGSTPASAVWNGSFDPTANSWSSGTTNYYDINGTKLANSTTTGVRFSVVSRIQDSGIIGTTTTYTLAATTKRSFTTTVTLIRDNSVAFVTGTILSPGGI